MYCYKNINNACVELAKDILTEIDYVISDDDVVKDSLVNLIDRFNQKMQKIAKEKSSVLMNAIDNSNLVN